MSKQKRALISGISGMDGENLTKLLLSKGYEVWGIIRRHSFAEGQTTRIDKFKDINLRYGDVCDSSSLHRILKECMPSKIFHLAAQSNVRISFDTEISTAQIVALGTLNFLDAYRNVCPEARFYSAVSSECFGSAVDPDGYQRETTRMIPVSSYGSSKCFAYNMGRIYRDGHKLFIGQGILFNHTGIGRSSNFSEQKIIKTLVMIKHGLASKLEMGNLKASRDVGSSIDYVRAMNMILDYNKPDDWVIGTGETYTIEQICEKVSEKLGINYKNYLVYNPIHERKVELPYLKADATKAKTLLGWKPEISFDEILESMINHWEQKIKDNCLISLN